MEIQIDKQKSLTDVYKYTGLAGQKLDKVDLIAATPDDQSLEGLMNEACSELETILGEWGYIKSHDTDTATIELTLPSNWNQSLSEPMKDNMQQYLAYSVLVKWYKEVKGEAVDYYISIRDKIGFRIRKQLCSRKKPTR